jgi:hypothetical protein
MRDGKFHSCSRCGDVRPLAVHVSSVLIVWPRASLIALSEVDAAIDSLEYAKHAIHRGLRRFGSGYLVDGRRLTHGSISMMSRASLQHAYCELCAFERAFVPSCNFHRSLPASTIIAFGNLASTIVRHASMCPECRSVGITERFLSSSSHVIVLCSLHRRVLARPLRCARLPKSSTELQTAPRRYTPRG